MSVDAETTSVDAPNTEELSAKLDQLKASATKEYSLKNYEAAAEFYSEAAELQDQINGEMSLENADLLYQYGRCLFYVAVANSDVLGGKVASAEEPKRKKRKTNKAESSASAAASDSTSTGGSLIADAISKSDAESKPTTTSTSSNAYFQITGDEAWTDSEEEDDGENADDNEGENNPDALEEEDDFATAYEILDMARVLLTRKLDLAKSQPTPTTTPLTDPTRQLRERLADTHDLQAEISLENERFTDAIHDTRQALALKLALYPPESSLLAEAHFKLSLALEFASVTSTSNNDDPNTTSSNEQDQTSTIDPAFRAEAAEQMSLAITSTKLRLAKEEAVLADLPKETPATAKDAEGRTRTELKRDIKDVKEMVAEMEQRLIDLRKPPVSLSAGAGAGVVGEMIGEEAIRGVLGAIMGESKSKGEAQKMLAEVTANANDLSGLVKKGKKAKVSGGEEEVGYEGKGKRKADDGQSANAGSVTNGKRVKFEDGV